MTNAHVLIYVAMAAFGCIELGFGVNDITKNVDAAWHIGLAVWFLCGMWLVTKVEKIIPND